MNEEEIKYNEIEDLDYCLELLEDRDKENYSLSQENSFLKYHIGEKDKEIERLKEQLNDEIQEELKQSEIMVKKQQEIERLNNIINGIDEILKEHINECRAELNIIMKSDDLDYINECSREFDVIRKNIEMIIEKIEELKGSDSN